MAGGKARWRLAATRMEDVQRGYQMSLETKNSDTWITRFVALCIGVFGILLAVGGGQLVAVGGSPYYLVAGIACSVAAVQVWMRRPLGARLYGAFLLATLAWALWEAGADGWALAPRLIAPAVIGLMFGTPWLRRALRGDAGVADALLRPERAALLSLAVLAVVAFVTSREPPSAQRELRAAASDSTTSAAPGEWTEWGRTLAGDRHSPLEQITPANVGQLKAAWTYHTGVAQVGARGGPEATPLMVDDTLYLCTQNNIVIALDPDSGSERWRFDPKVDMSAASGVATCRGVAFFRAPQATDCPERIISATFSGLLIAVDAHSGKPCATFGEQGFVDLKKGLGDVPTGFYYVSSAPTIVNGHVIVGGWVADNQSTNEPSGVVRAFSAATGAFVWAWDMGRPDYHGEPAPGETYTRSTPNVWAPMSADAELGLVYVPTGNPTPDHWGGNRPEHSDKFGSSVVAIEVATGAVRWSFQTTHHDLWDYDVPSQPTLFEATVDGKPVPALMQPTKRGELFVLDRRTGTPVSNVEELPVPQRGAVADERYSPTQPFSTGMPSFGGPPLKESDMWGVSPLDQLWCRIEFRKLRYDGPLTPLGLDRSLIYPSIGGGMNWGGVSIDAQRGIMITNSMYYGTIAQLLPRAETDRRLEILKTGGLSVTNFAIPLPMAGAPYGILMSGLMSPLNAPCNKPPYGTLSAVDLRNNKLLWTRPIGSARDTGPLGIDSHLPIPMGMPMFGGAITTRSGLLFIGATQDSTFRAFETASGRLLWSARLPAGGNSNPMTYVSPKTGKQYVIIYAGGHVLLRSKPGDSVIAYALPASAPAAAATTGN